MSASININEIESKKKHTTTTIFLERNTNIIILYFLRIFYYTKNVVALCFIIINIIISDNLCSSQNNIIKHITTATPSTHAPDIYFPPTRIFAQKKNGVHHLKIVRQIPHSATMKLICSSVANDEIFIPPQRSRVNDYWCTFVMRIFSSSATLLLLLLSKRTYHRKIIFRMSSTAFLY